MPWMDRDEQFGYSQPSSKLGHEPAHVAKQRKETTGASPPVSQPGDLGDSPTGGATGRDLLSEDLFHRKAEVPIAHETERAYYFAPQSGDNDIGCGQQLIRRKTHAVAIRSAQSYSRGKNYKLPQMPPAVRFESAGDFQFNVGMYSGGNRNWRVGKLHVVPSRTDEKPISDNR